MKYVYLVLGILAVVLMIFNSTQIDTNAPFKEIVWLLLLVL